MNIKTKIRIYKLLINRRIESDEIVSNYNDTKAKIYIDKEKALSAAYKNIKKANEKTEYNKNGKYKYEITDDDNKWIYEIRVEKDYFDFTKDVIYSY